MERRKPAILLVDEEPSAIFALAYGIAEAGYRVFLATSVDAAIEAAATDDFDGALLNLHTPTAAGLKLVEKLRRMTEPKARSWPIWLMANSTGAEIYQRASEMRVRNVFIKPPQVQAIVHELALVLSSVASGYGSLKGSTRRRGEPVHSGGTGVSIRASTGNGRHFKSINPREVLARAPTI